MSGNILFLGNKIFEIPPFFQTRPGDLGKKVHACSLRFSALKDIINSQTAWVRVGSSLFLKWRPSGLVKIGKIEDILTSEQTPLWYR